MISCYLWLARRLTASSRGPQVPPWDLYLVLEALKHPPFEPLGNVALKWLSLKTAFLLAITSARRIGELHALSVHRDCCTFSPEGSKVVLRPNPAFLPKVLSDFHLSQSIELQSAAVSAADQLALCPVRALSEYVRPALCVFSHYVVACVDHCRSVNFLTGLWTPSSKVTPFRALLPPPGFEHTQPAACRLLGLCGGLPLSPPYAQQPLGPPTPRSPDSTA